MNPSSSGKRRSFAGRWAGTAVRLPCTLYFYCHMDKTILRVKTGSLRRGPSLQAAVQIVVSADGVRPLGGEATFANSIISYDDYR